MAVVNLQQQQALVRHVTMLETELEKSFNRRFDSIPDYIPELAAIYSTDTKWTPEAQNSRMRVKLFLYANDPNNLKIIHDQLKITRCFMIVYTDDPGKESRYERTLGAYARSRIDQFMKNVMMDTMKSITGTSGGNIEMQMQKCEVNSSWATRYVMNELFDRRTRATRHGSGFRSIEAPISLHITCVHSSIFVSQDCIDDILTGWSHFLSRTFDVATIMHVSSTTGISRLIINNNVAPYDGDECECKMGYKSVVDRPPTPFYVSIPDPNSVHFPNGKTLLSQNV